MNKDTAIYEANVMSVGVDSAGNVWTEEDLIKLAPTFKGKPVNVNYDASSVVGSVLKAWYDSHTKKLRCALMITSAVSVKTYGHAGFGVICEKLKCPICGKEATGQEHKCEHMRADNANARPCGNITASEIALYAADAFTSAEHKLKKSKGDWLYDY